MHVRTLKIHAQQAFSHWLAAEPWDLFLTLTDPGVCHPETMYKRTRYFMNAVNRDLYGNNWRRRHDGIEHVIGLERQKRYSCHSHSLIRLPDHDASDPAQFSLRRWQAFAQELGGFAWLEVPNNGVLVVDYVTKYVCKDGEVYLSESFNPHSPRTFSHTLIGSAETRH